MANRESELRQYIFGQNHNSEQEKNPTNQDAARYEQLRSVFEKWNLIFWEQSYIDGSCVLTDYASRLFGIPTKCDNFPSCLFGKGILSQQTEAAFRRADYRLRVGEEHFTFEAVVNSSVDMPKWLEVECSLEFDAEGIPAYAIGTAHDISSKKMLEQKYQDQIAYRNGLCANTLNCMRIDLTEDRITEYNTPVAEITDMCAAFPSADACLRKITADMVRSADVEKYKDILSTEGLLSVYNSGNNNVVVEYYDTMMQRWLQINFVILKNPLNSHIECFGICNDISETKLTEIALYGVTRRNYGFVGILDKLAGEFLYMARSQTNGTKLLTCETIEQVTAFILQEWKASFEAEEYAEVEKQFAAPKIQQALEHGSFYEFQTRARDDVGELRNYSVNFSYIDKDRTHLLIACADVTVAVQTEMQHQEQLSKALGAAEQASLAKTEFLSRMSHEIRTPINAVTGLAELTKQTLADRTMTAAQKTEELVSFAEEIVSSTKYLLSIVNDILDTAKIESGKVELHPERFEMCDCLDTIKTIIAPLAYTKNIHLQCDDSKLVNHTFLGDRTRIQQIIMNLLNNAIKFTPKGGTVSLKIAETATDEAHATLAFEIKDTGCGMSEAFQKTMFEPFTQEYNNHIVNSTGTGLGLSISRKLAQMMGGDILCRSAKDKGTTFLVTVRLPILCGTAGDTLEQLDEDWDFTGVSVLVCEDHPLNQKIIKRLLENKGCVVDAVGNGKLAVEAFRQSNEGHYKIIFMDIRMPEMDGLTATREIRALSRNDAASTPIIAMSANAYEQDARESLDAGVNRHLSKPVDPRVMYQTMKQFL